MTHYPVSNRDSPRSPEGKGTTPEFPITPNRASTSDAPANSPGSADASHEFTTALPRRLPVHRTRTHINIDGRGQTLLNPQLASSDACLCIHWGLRPPHLTGVAPTPGTGMHSRPVHQAPPSGPFYSDEAQHSATPLTSALAHADDRPAPRPFGDTTARAPLSLPSPCTSPTASRADRGGGEWRPDAAPGLLDGCILGPATHPSGGAGTDRTLHGRRHRPRPCRPSRPVSSCVAACGCPTPCDRCAWPTRQTGRHRGGGGSVSDGSGRPRAPLPIVPLRRHHAGTTETVVSRETRTSIVPSDCACLPIPHLSGRTHSRRSPPGDRSLRRASSSSAAPSGDHRSGPPARQPFTAGAPRPAISAAASRYATAPAEAGS
ncbi:hypothetical protein BX598_0917 [Micrococcaceae bacterium JKS001869]|nr:hypothetical protein BX598_0917 [Micrococcaceae bacterium JKS001869]